MENKICITDLKAGQLNRDCLVLLAKFARELKAREGIILKLQDKAIISKVEQYARMTDDAELKILHQLIRHELRNYIASPTFEAKKAMIIHKIQQDESRLSRWFR